MTQSIQILQLLADGKKRTIAKIAAEMNLSKDQVGYLVRKLATENELAFSITLSGSERLRAEPFRLQEMKRLKSLKQVLKKAKLRREAKAAGAKVPERRFSSRDLLSDALSSRPALDMAWGATLGAREGAQA